MRKLIIVLTLVSAFFGYAQDVVMQNGTFNRCAPDKFFDSGGEFANYGNNENLITTICPQNAGEFIILDFLSFTTQLGLDPDRLNIYDGDDTTANLLGTFQGPEGAFTVSASDTNASGCLTMEFISDGSGSIDGWEADILCATACQDIVASIDSTTPAPNATGVISILPGETVDFSGSATFSVDGSNATYNWDFGDGNTAVGTNASNTFNTAGTYTVTFTATDDNPQGCTGTETITVFVLGPNVVVDQDLFTPEELIEDVLVNSPCASVSNITWSTGINFSPIEPNGIGYFFSDGINFPFEDGVLLTSGNASEVEGPNGGPTIGAGSGAWPGDLDLDAVAGTGTTNATYIQFDFVPLANNISFEFLMASEEYNMGSFECTYSDAFAFLLTDALGNTTNLAVIPGTNTPITVTNIHQANASCGAINEEYFGGYTPPFSPPMAFDGRTTVFTAQSPVNPGETYTIKLVIGDDGNGFGDTILDSGVFLKAGSFDLGGDLGEDITIASGTARCGGSAVELDTGLTSATHTWYYEGIEIIGETGSLLSVTEPGRYSVNIIFSGICQTTDSILVEFIPSPSASPAVDLFECNSTGSAEFDLSQNDTNILGTFDPTDFIVSYHLIEQDAIDNVGALPTNYTNISDPQIIWARIADSSQACFDVVSFSLNLSGQPVINPVADIEVCDDGLNDGTELFNLDSQTLGILGAQDPGSFEVTYHLSFADADGDVGALTSPFPNTVSPQPIYVRVETIGDGSCYSASLNPVFNLIVNPRDDASFSVTPTCDGATVDLPLATPGGTFTFNPVPTDGATIDPITGTVTSGASGQSYTIEYTTTGTCPSTSAQAFGVSVTDDPSFEMDPSCDGGTAINVVTPGGTFGFNPAPTDTATIDPNTGEVTLATPGASYTVEYTTNGTCPASSTEVLTVLTLDDPAFDLDPTCDGAIANITGDTGGTFTFNPDPGDGALLDTASGTITNGISGSTYSVEYTTNGDCPQSSTQTVTVTEEDDASFTVTATCDGGISVPGATTTAGGIYSFDTAPTDGAAVDPNTGEITNGTPDTSYTITYSTTGICAASETVTFSSLPIDDAGFAVAPTCDGGTAIDIATPGGTFGFSPLPVDGAIIDINTGNVTNGTPGETYSITYTTNGICPNSSTVEFTANPLPTIVVPTPLEVCDDGTPDGLTEIDLEIKNDEITGNNPGYTVSYYLDQGDADMGINALPIPYTNISNPQTVYVRVEDVVTGCYDTTTLELVVEQAPVTFDPQPLRYCDPDNDGFGFFTLTDADNEITGGVPGLTVTYHDTEDNANLGVDAIDTSVAYGNINIDMETLYARVESETIATDCFTVVELELMVDPTPQLVEPTLLEACDDISADGFAQFDLTVKEPEILGGQDPADYVVTYYELEADADMGNNAIAVPTAYTNTNDFNHVVWVRVDYTNTVSGCYKLTTLALRVNPLPVLATPSPIELCDVNSPGDEQEAFNLEDANAEILNGLAGVTLTYYETQMDADMANSAIAVPTAYTNISNAQTIYVRGENAFGCVEFTTITIRVLPIPTPTPSDQIPVLELCDDNNIGDGLEVFDLTVNEMLILNGEAGVTPTYHTAAEDADMGASPIADPANYTNTAIGGDETVYVRVTNDVTGCYSVVNFIIRVNPLPQDIAVTDFIRCELNTDGFDSFDLGTKDAEVLNGQDPIQFVVTYHGNLADAQAGANVLVSPYTNTSNPQEIFVTITDTSTGCSISTQRFDIEVQESAEANPDMQAILYQECDDNMEVDGNPVNDSVQFDLATRDAQVLDGQDPTGYAVTYFATEADANLNVSPLPALYENTVNPQVIYARVDNTDTTCFAVAPLTLQVNPLPAFDLEDGYILCVNTNGTEALDPLVLDTGLSDVNYGFEWSFNGTAIPGATGPSLMPQQGGTYSVTVTDTSTSTVTGCTNTDTTEVVESEPPSLVVELVTQAFAENHVIEATASGPGEYEYSLDGGPWQDSGTFSGVSPGQHEVTARDRNGCGTATEPVFVIDYPLYFTPNGDGNHDTWNIAGIGGTAKIYIFDRYGKLLKQISPTGSGWDGTYNGNSMPSSDYWFVVEYDEPVTNQRKELNAHFTLKR